MRNSILICQRNISELNMEGAVKVARGILNTAEQYEDIESKAGSERRLSIKTEDTTFGFVPITFDAFVPVVKMLAQHDERMTLGLYLIGKHGMEMLP